MHRKKGLKLGDRVLLMHEMVQGDRGRSIPVGTCGTLVGLIRGVPQVDFGVFGVKNVVPHAIEVLDRPDGAPEPEDGDDLAALVAYLVSENAALRRQLAGFYTPALWRS